MMMEELPVTSGQIPKAVASTNKIVFSANKAVRSNLLHALRTQTHSKNKIIPFPEVTRVFSWWKIRKEERDEILYHLQQGGFLKIVPFHGVILKEGQQ